MSRTAASLRPVPPLPEIPGWRFGKFSGRMTFAPGRVRPECYSDAAIRALPGRGIRWAIGTGPARARAMTRAVQRSEPGELIIVTDDLAVADRWYLWILDARGVAVPWWVRRSCESWGRA
jgi:hypothetical protein